MGCFSCINNTFLAFFGGPFGLIFFLVVRQIFKSLNTITGKFVLKVIFIYVWGRGWQFESIKSLVREEEKKQTG